MSMRKRLMTRGLVLLGSFFVVLVLIFTPIFPGKVNGLDYMDNLFNMISKGSSNFIAKVGEESKSLNGKSFEVSIKSGSESQLNQIAAQLTKNGIDFVKRDGAMLIKGDLGRLAAAALEDAKVLFANDGSQLQQKYGVDPRLVVHSWWNTLRNVSSGLKEQDNFGDAKLLDVIGKKALEPAYNYYGVEARNWQDNVGLILASLAFYVMYTLWYGFGIMYLFEGLGLRIGH